MHDDEVNAGRVVYIYVDSAERLARSRDKEKCVCQLTLLSIDIECAIFGSDEKEV